MGGQSLPGINKTGRFQARFASPFASDYPDAAMFARLRQSRLFRTALLVLLALGMVVKPTLAALGELHDAEHAAHAVAHGHGHDHDHGRQHGPDGDPGPNPHSPAPEDPDHVLGAHGLLHTQGSVSLALSDIPIRLVPVAAPALPLPDLDAPRLPGDAPSVPFRPPIA